VTAFFEIAGMMRSLLVETILMEVWQVPEAADELGAYRHCR
jgi:hypothetical protein